MELAEVQPASVQVSGKGGKDVKGKAAPAKPKPAPAAAAAVPGKGSVADKAKAAAAAAAVAAAEAAAAKREQALATMAKVQGIRSSGGDAASVEQRLQVCPVNGYLLRTAVSSRDVLLQAQQAQSSLLLNTTSWSTAGGLGRM